MSAPAKDGPVFTATANALAGAAEGIIAMTIVFPLDVCSCSLQLLRFGSTMAYNCVLWQMIRTRLQVQATNNEPKSVTSSDSNIEEEYLDDDMKEIVTEQDFRTFGFTDLLTFGLSDFIAVTIDVGSIEQR